MALGPEGELQFNSGVVVYRTTPCMRKFFELWESIYMTERHCLKGTPWDQCALNLALRRTPHLKTTVLSEAYNCRNRATQPRPLFVVHDRQGMGSNCGGYSLPSLIKNLSLESSSVNASCTDSSCSREL